MTLVTEEIRMHGKAEAAGLRDEEDEVVETRGNGKREKEESRRRSTGNKKINRREKSKEESAQHGYRRSREKEIKGKNNARKQNNVV